MATYHKDAADARLVTRETRAAALARLSEAAFTSFLPDSYEETDRYEFNTNTVTGTPAVEHRAYDTEAPFGSEEQSFAFSGKIPPLSQKMRLSEARQKELQGGNAFRDAIIEKAQINGIAIATGSLLARGEVLETGKFTRAGEAGLHFTVDFQRPAEHTVTAAALWSAASTDVVGDLLAWQATYRGSNGADAGAIVLSSAILNGLTTNTNIIAEARPGVTASRVSPAEVRGVLATYGFNNVVVNDDLAVMADGTQKRVIGADKILLLPGASGSVQGSTLGKTQWGIPAEAFNATYGISGSERSGIFGANFHGNDPEGFYVLGSAVMLPVLTNAKATFAATVL